MSREHSEVFSREGSVSEVDPARWRAALPFPTHLAGPEPNAPEFDPELPPQEQPYKRGPTHYYKSLDGSVMFLRIRWVLQNMNRTRSSFPRNKIPITYFCVESNGDHRWISSNQKDILLRDLGGKWCLYGLEKLTQFPDKKVLLVEGEGCADAVNAHPEIFPHHVAVSATLFGAIDSQESLESYDFAPLEGREVTVWADFDYPGQRAAQTICSRFRHWKLLQMPEDSGLAVGWDAADFLEGRKTEEEARALLGQARRFTGVAYDTSRKVAWNRDFAEEMGAALPEWVAEQEQEMRRTMIRDGDLDYENRSMFELETNTTSVIRKVSERLRRDGRSLFARAGTPVVVNNSTTPPSFVSVGAVTCASKASDKCSIYRIRRRETKYSLTLEMEDLGISESIGRELMENNGNSLPPIKAIAHSATLVPGFRVLTSGRGEGFYDEETQFWVHTPGEDVAIPPSRCNHAVSMEKAGTLYAQFLELAGGDVAFDEPIHGARWIAATLTAMVRRSFGIATPAFLFHANNQSSGKTTAAQIISVLTNRTEAKTFSMGTGEEIDKTLVAALRAESTSMLIFDNLREAESLSSAAHAQAITNKNPSFRLMRSSDPVTFDNPPVLFYTGNNISIDRDLASRVLRIELDARVADPTKRRFRNPDWESHILTIRPTLWRILYDLMLSARGHSLDSNPRGALTPSRFNSGGDSSWDHLVRLPIWIASGIDVAYTAIESEGSAGKDALIQELHDLMILGMRRQLVGAPESYIPKFSFTQLAENSEINDVLRFLVEEMYGSSVRFNPKRVGMMLRGIEKRIIRGQRLKITKTDNRSTYRIVNHDETELELTPYDDMPI